MPQKINILHINNSHILSQYLLSIGRLHDSDKYNLIIGCFDYYGPINRELEKINIRTVNFPARGQHPVFYFFKMVSLVRFLRKEKIDILHLHTFFPGFFGVLAGKLAGVKQIVLTRHHADSHVIQKKRLHIKIDSWTARHCSKVIAVSDFVKEIMIKHEGVPEAKVKVIYNGMEPLKVTGKKRKDYQNEFNLKKDELFFLCICRLHPDKNIETAIKAMGLLTRQGMEVKLIITGAGLGNEYHNFLQSVAANEGVGNNVLFPGFRNDIGDLIEACDALVHPSLNESFGFSVIEAMSLKKPVFATNIPAMREVITGEIGFLFSPSDEKHLAAIIKEWMADKSNYEERLMAGVQRYMKLFAFTTMIKKYEEYYEEK